MTITIAPFTVDTNCSFRAPAVGYDKEAQTKKGQGPITYWRIYMDDKYISYTSSKELAEKTKAWMEKWLRERS